MPGDTAWSRLRFRTHIWIKARLLPFFIMGKDLTGVLGTAEPPGQTYPSYSVDYIGRSVRWAVRGPLLMRDRRCLRSGLLGYEFLRRSGYTPELCFSVDSNAATAAKIEAHCWVCVDDTPVVNEPKPGHVLLLRHPIPKPAAASAK